MGEAIAEMIGETGGEDLRFILKPSKSAGVDDAVAVTLKFVPVRVREFGITASPRALHGEAQVSENGSGHLVGLRKPADQVDGGAADGGA
jgi:hypothetical protein